LLPAEAKTIAAGSLPNPENECPLSINHCCSCTLDNLTGDSFQTSINEVLATFWGKIIASRFQPHDENEFQWSINDLWSYILADLSVTPWQ